MIDKQFLNLMEASNEASKKFLRTRNKILESIENNLKSLQKSIEELSGKIEDLVPTGSRSRPVAREGRLNSGFDYTTRNLNRTLTRLTRVLEKSSPGGFRSQSFDPGKGIRDLQRYGKEMKRFTDNSSRQLDELDEQLRKTFNKEREMEEFQWKAKLTFGELDDEVETINEHMDNIFGRSRQLEMRRWGLETERILRDVERQSEKTLKPWDEFFTNLRDRDLFSSLAQLSTVGLASDIRNTLEERQESTIEMADEIRRKLILSADEWKYFYEEGMTILRRMNKEFDYAFSDKEFFGTMKQLVTELGVTSKEALLALTPQITKFKEALGELASEQIEIFVRIHTEFGEEGLRLNEQIADAVKMLEATIPRFDAGKSLQILSEYSGKLLDWSDGDINKFRDLAKQFMAITALTERNYIDSQAFLEILNEIKSAPPDQLGEWAEQLGKYGLSIIDLQNQLQRGDWEGAALKMMTTIGRVLNDPNLTEAQKNWLKDQLKLDSRAITEITNSYQDLADQLIEINNTIAESEGAVERTILEQRRSWIEKFKNWLTTTDFYQKYQEFLTALGMTPTELMMTVAALMKIGEVLTSLVAKAIKWRQVMSETKMPTPPKGTDIDLDRPDKTASTEGLPSRKERRLQKRREWLKKPFEAMKSAAQSNKGLFKAGGVVAAGIGAYNVYESLKEGDAQGAVSAIGSTLGSLAGGALGGSALGAAAGSVFGPVGTAIGGAIGGIAGSVAGAFFGEQFTNWAYKKSGEIAQGVSNAWQSVKEVGSSMAQSVGDAASQAWSKIEEVGGQVKDKVVGFFAPVTQEFNRFWDNMPGGFVANTGYILGYGVQKFTELRNAIADKMSTIASTVATKASEAYRSFTGWMSQLPGNVLTWFSNAYTNLTTSLKNWGSYLLTKGQEFASNFTSWMKNLPGNVAYWFGQAKAAAAGFFDWASTKLSNLWTNIKDFGSGIAQGVKSGWESFKGWVSSKVSQFKSGYSKGKSTASKSTGAVPYAEGGILTRPHLGLVAEDGPEAIIPLSPDKRTRALSLWQQVGQLLGVSQYAIGGLAGNVMASVNATLSDPMTTEPLIEQITNNFNTIKNTAISTWDQAKNAGLYSLQQISYASSTTMSNITQKASSSWQSVASSSSNAFLSIAQQALSTQSTVINVWNSIKNSAASIWNNIKQMGAGLWGNISSAAQLADSVWKKIKDWIGLGAGMESGPLRVDEEVAGSLGSFRITSLFGTRRDPFTGATKFHRGVDLAAPTGTPIAATTPGRVIFAGFGQYGTGFGGFGNVVAIQDPSGLIHIYAHQSRLAVKTGDFVHAGQKIGYVGSTGRSTGPHLHYEVRQGLRGPAINPMPFLKGVYGSVLARSGYGGMGGGNDIYSIAASIIAGNEGGYTSVVASDNGHGMSIGRFQWHEDRAKALLWRMRNANRALFDSIANRTAGGRSLLRKMSWKSWDEVKLTAAEVAAVKQILAQPEFIKIQDLQIRDDLNGYFNVGRSLGITDPKALVYFADLYNQSPASARRVASRAASKTLQGLHKAALADPVLGKYASRRNKTYAKLAGTSISTASSTSSSASSSQAKDGLPGEGTVWVRSTANEKYYKDLIYGVMKDPYFRIMNPYLLTGSGSQAIIFKALSRPTIDASKAPLVTSYLQAIMDAKVWYERAKQKGDKAGMQSAHRYAEYYRSKLKALGVNPDLFSSGTNLYSSLRNFNLLRFNFAPSGNPTLKGFVNEVQQSYSKTPEYMIQQAIQGIIQAKKDYGVAQKAGNTKGMQAAHEKAEQYRKILASFGINPDHFSATKTLTQILNNAINISQGSGIDAQASTYYRLNSPLTEVADVMQKAVVAGTVDPEALKLLTTVVATGRATGVSPQVISDNSDVVNAVKWLAFRLERKLDEITAQNKEMEWLKQKYEEFSQSPGNPFADFS